MSSSNPAVLDEGADLDTITTLLAALTVHEREVIILTTYCGYSYHQAADALGLSDSTVLARISSGLRRLESDAIPDPVQP